MSKETIGVIGAGTMGNGIAQTFAMAGYEVVMQDISDGSLDHGKATIEHSLSRLEKKEKIAPAEAKAALERVRTTTNINELATCDLIVEAIVENIDVKSKVIKQLDDICPPETIFASNTSSISLTKLASASAHPERVIGMHFFNPVPVMQLVEIIRALQTSDDVLREDNGIDQGNREGAEGFQRQLRLCSQ